MILKTAGSGDAGGEVERMGVASLGAIAELDVPETLDCDRVACAIPEHAEELPCGRVKRVDAAIPEVADEQGLAEAAKACRCECNTPG